MRKEPTTLEKKRIEFFCTWLNNKRGTSFQPDRWPDSTTPNDIDCVLRDCRTNQEIPVELSSIWQSETAGKEDNDFNIWSDAVQEMIRGKVAGVFHVGVPMGIQEVSNPEIFGKEMIECISHHRDEIARASPNSGAYDAKIDGLDVFIALSTNNGSDIGLSRRGAVALDSNNVRRILDKKCPKLKKYKEQGLETWLILQNTAWPVTSLSSLKGIFKGQLRPEHDHANHIGVIYGNSPDAALIEIR